ncbi:DegT/DnrJ/EryC1/StrS family aminotransferase [Alphaproteobacteria bacterium]|nr:DegT/DnrJ/EryC1/StrS family aminotransferase [Alphaproteobacteria bacterium]
MKVYYNYLPNEFSDVSKIFDEWKALINSTDFTLGRYVEMFENKFKNFLGVKHCISTNNGTDALILSLKSLGVGPGHEVITVTNTFYATVGAIVAVGATPVLIDSDDRFQINVDKISENITEKTKAIMPVHWGGASPEMESIIEIANSNNLFVIEDACMGIGASINGISPGNFGKVNAFSMHPLKSLNVMGDGGMVVTNDDEIAQWIKKYRNHGMVDRDHIDFWGVNMRLQPLQAIVASNRLDFLDETIHQRNVNAKFLDHELDKLKKFVTIPERLDGYLETFALYMGLFEKRDELKNFLIENDIEVKIHYPLPLHKQKAAKSNCILTNYYENSEIQADKLLTIPVHQYLNLEHMEFVVKKIREFYRC